MKNKNPFQGLDTPELTETIQNIYASWAERLRLQAAKRRHVKAEQKELERECSLLLDNIRSICPPGTGEREILALFKVIAVRHAAAQRRDEDLQDFSREFLRNIGEL